MAKRYTTVVQINEFKARVKGRMTAAEFDAVTDMLAADPLCGN